MLKEYFTKKQAELLEEKAKIEAVDNSEQIALEVEDFKLQKAKEIEEFETLTKKKYDDIRKADLNKISDYLEFVDKSLKEISVEENATETVEENIVAQEVQGDETNE